MSLHQYLHLLQSYWHLLSLHHQWHPFWVSPHHCLHLCQIVHHLLWKPCHLCLHLHYFQSHPLVSLHQCLYLLQHLLSLHHQWHPLWVSPRQYLHLCPIVHHLLWKSCHLCPHLHYFQSHPLVLLHQCLHLPQPYQHLLYLHHQWHPFWVSPHQDIHLCLIEHHLFWNLCPHHRYFHSHPVEPFHYCLCLPQSHLHLHQLLHHLHQQWLCLTYPSFSFLLSTHLQL